MPIASLTYNIEKFDYVAGATWSLHPDARRRYPCSRTSCPNAYHRTANRHRTDPSDTFVLMGHNPSRTPQSVLIHNSAALEITKTNRAYEEIDRARAAEETYQRTILDRPFEGVFIVRKPTQSPTYCKFECLKETTLANTFKYSLL